MADCVPDPDDACETNLDTDPAHCGQCDVPCNGECQGGQCSTSKIVFVSAFLVSGVGGPAGADSLCTDWAGDVNLPGTYAAWLSDGNTSPAERFHHAAVPYVRPDDVVVANNWADLTDGTLDAPISIDQNGVEVGGTCDQTGVWTGSTQAGTYAGGADCSGWTTNDDNEIGSVVGSAVSQTSGWTVTGCPPRSCGEPAHIYCFQQ